MAGRAEAYANQIEALSAEVASFVESVDDAGWTAVVPADGRPLNVLIDHISVSGPLVYSLVEMVMSGQPLPPLTQDDIHGGNAQHASERASVTKADVLEGLRSNLQTVAAKTRALSDDALDTSVAFSLSESGQITPAEIIEHIVIGHTRGHLEQARGVTS